MEFEGFDDDGEPIRIMPCIELECELGRLALTYLNTRLRLFGDDEMNHVEYKDEEHGTLGMKVTPELMEALYENNYPMSFDPLTDSSTLEWFIQLQTRDLDGEIDSL